MEILDVDFSNDLDIEEWSRSFYARRISISEFGKSLFWGARFIVLPTGYRK